MKTPKLYLLVLFICGCTRPVSDSSRVSLSLSGQAGLSVRELKTELTGMGSFGANSVELIDEVDCIGAFAMASGAAESCETSMGEVLPFTHISGFVGLNETLTLDLPSGPGRKIYVVGVRNLEGGSCPTLLTADRMKISRPRIIAAVEKDLPPGEVQLSVTADMGGDEIEGCESKRMTAKSVACDLTSGAVGVHSDQVIVHMSDYGNLTRFDDEFQYLGLSAIDGWDGIGSYHFMLPAGLTLSAAAAELCANPAVQFVEAVDTLISPRYYNSLVDHSPDVNTKTVVAVLSTGLKLTHPTFAGITDSYWTNPFGETGADEDSNGLTGDINGYNFVGDDSDISDPDGAGTQLAGAVLGQDVDIFSPSGSSNIQVLPVKVLDGSGNTNSTLLASGILYAADMNADVILLAFGGSGGELVRRALTYASNRGVLLVAAAGNTSDDNDAIPIFPSSYKIPNIVSVASHTSTLTKSTFSNYGKLSVDIAGSGNSVYTTEINDAYVQISGTSMAAAVVAGGAAVAKNGATAISGFQLKTAIMDSAVLNANWANLTVSEGYFDLSVLVPNVVNNYGSAVYFQPEQ